MPQSQGKIPRIRIPGRMVGADENGAFTNNSQEYRGRPYSQANLIDQMAVDFQRESAKISFQRGLRTVALYITTGTITPSH